jgi:hypothetical protein
MENSELLMNSVLYAMVGYCASFWVFYFFIDTVAKSSVSKDANSTWKNFTEMSQKDKYLYLSYVNSIANAVVCLAYCLIGASRCDPPTEFRNDGVTLGNTYLRNTWCVENPNI